MSCEDPSRTVPSPFSGGGTLCPSPRFISRRVSRNVSTTCRHLRPNQTQCCGPTGSCCPTAGTLLPRRYSGSGGRPQIVDSVRFQVIGRCGVLRCQGLGSK